MIRLIILCLLAALLVGCIGGVSTPTQFYSLNSHDTLTNTLEINSAKQVSVGIGPITLPDSLNRPQIVTREANHRITIAEFHHWAGDLKDDLLKLLTASLIQNLQSNRISQYPWPRYATPAYQIRINILNFDGSLANDSLTNDSPENKVVFNGTWSLLSRDKSKEIEINAFSFNKPLSNNSYSALVDAMSQSVELLAQQIVDVIKLKQQL